MENHNQVHQIFHYTLLNRSKHDEEEKMYKVIVSIPLDIVGMMSNFIDHY